MTRKPIILAGLCAILLAAPAFAQSSDTSPSNSSNHVSGAPSSAPTSDQQQDSKPNSVGSADIHNNNGMPMTRAPDMQKSGSEAKSMGSQGSAHMEQKMAPRHPMASNGQRKAKMASNSRSRSCYDFAWQSKEMNDCLARNPQQEQAGQPGNAPRGQYGTAPSQNNPNGKGPTQ